MVVIGLLVPLLAALHFTSQSKIQWTAYTDLHLRSYLIAYSVYNSVVSELQNKAWGERNQVFEKVNTWYHFKSDGKPVDRESAWKCEVFVCETPRGTTSEGLYYRDSTIGEDDKKLADIFMEVANPGEDYRQKWFFRVEYRETIFDKLTRVLPCVSMPLRYDSSGIRDSVLEDLYNIVLKRMVRRNSNLIKSRVVAWNIKSQLQDANFRDGQAIDFGRSSPYEGEDIIYYDVEEYSEDDIGDSIAMNQSNDGSSPLDPRLPADNGQETGTGNPDNQGTDQGMGNSGNQGIGQASDNSNNQDSSQSGNGGDQVSSSGLLPGGNEEIPTNPPNEVVENPPDEGEEDLPDEVVENPPEKGDPPVKDPLADLGISQEEVNQGYNGAILENFKWDRTDVAEDSGRLDEIRDLIVAEDIDALLQKYDFLTAEDLQIPDDVDEREERIRELAEKIIDHELNNFDVVVIDYHETEICCTDSLEEGGLLDGFKNLIKEGADNVKGLLGNETGAELVFQSMVANMQVTGGPKTVTALSNDSTISPYSDAGQGQAYNVNFGGRDGIIMNLDGKFYIQQDPGEKFFELCIDSWWDKQLTDSTDDKYGNMLNDQLEHYAPSESNVDEIAQEQ